MAKAVRNLKKMRSALEKVDHSSPLKTNIPAGMALAGPPLGSQLGQRGINIGQFCKDFNERTKEFKEGIPIPTRVSVNPDRTYTIVFYNPPISFLVKQAAGLERGAMNNSTEIAGKISLKHVYEIAKLKSEDPPFECVPLKDICQQVIYSAYKAGIHVVPKLDEHEYGQFMEERRAIVQAQLAEIEEKRQAKMLRTA